MRLGPALPGSKSPGRCRRLGHGQARRPAERLVGGLPLLAVLGESRKAVQYVLGNPLIAVQMTRHHPGAGLYAPLRLLVYEDQEGKTWLEYDKPSSLFGQFRDDRVDAVAALLDRKVEELVAAVRQ